MLKRSVEINILKYNFFIINYPHNIHPPFGSLAGKKLKHIINKVIPVVVVIIGILFILRGLELGIKYISPPPQKLQVKEKSEPAKVNWEMHKCGQGKCGGQ